MTDTDYIPANRRDHNDTCQYVMTEPHGTFPCNCTKASHAVADSVMRELAEALKTLMNRLDDIDYCICPEISCDCCEWCDISTKALDRYDNLQKAEKE